MVIKMLGLILLHLAGSGNKDDVPYDWHINYDTSGEPLATYLICCFTISYKV